MKLMAKSTIYYIQFREITDKLIILLNVVNMYHTFGLRVVVSIMLKISSVDLQAKTAMLKLIHLILRC